jgi:hypothetical protein
MHNAHALCTIIMHNDIAIKCIFHEPYATWNNAQCAMWPVGRLLAFSCALATCSSVRRCVLGLVLVHVGVGVGSVDLFLAFRNGNMLMWYNSKAAHHSDSSNSIIRCPLQGPGNLQGYLPHGDKHHSVSSLAKAGQQHLRMKKTIRKMDNYLV